MLGKFVTVLASAALSVGALQSAAAADLPRKAPVLAPMAVAAYSWTGCYGGLVGGYQWGRSRQDYGGLVNGIPVAFAPIGFDLSGRYDVDGGQLGGTLGCNYQTHNWVFGIEGDGSWVSAFGHAQPGNPAAIALGLNPNFTFETDQRWMATLRGRIGYALDHWLFFATGGVVWGGIDVNNRNITGAPTAQRRATRIDKAGWIAGLGVEYGWSNGLSVKSEWLYADYGTLHYGDEPGTLNGCPAGCLNADVKYDAFIWRLGLNYRFYK